MPEFIAWKIGGDQGEGIDSTGDVVATVVNRMGYHVYGYKSFSSRIKGGHTHYKVRISHRDVRSAVRPTHLLVALTQETIDKSVSEVVAGGAVVADEAFSPVLPEGSPATLVTIPMTQIARDCGNVLMRNMVAVGATSALLNLPLDAFKAYVAEKFGAKGDEVVQQNVKALESGFDYAKENMPEGLGFRLPPPDGKGPRLLLTGNQAIAMGALAAGCRVMAAYPITPASDVMENLVGLFPDFGGAVCQMEDEIAAITAVAGAGYAGARAMTATSGPGFSLMQEALGLAAVAEIPLVVVDCQRTGPSTGMPTKNEQSDIMAAIFGGHGDGGRIVLSPGTAEEAFADTAEAFNLAERYQSPVILLSDLSLSQWTQTIDDLPLSEVSRDRGELWNTDGSQEVPRGSFPRYAVTSSGVSPRSIPGVPFGQYLATGAEHLPTGKVSEDPGNRRSLVEKRARKLDALADAPGGTSYRGPDRPDLLIVCFGSVVGAVDEAMDDLPALSVGRLQVRRLWPFPKAAVAEAFAKAGSVLFVEHNATGQLRRLTALSGVGHPRTDVHLKYDGLLYTAEEIGEAIRAQTVAEEVS